MNFILSTFDEARDVFGDEINRYADSVRERLGVTPNEQGQKPAVPNTLLVAEAVYQRLINRRFDESDQG